MFVSTQSKPIDYSAIQIRLNIPWKCEYVKYYISSINTKANILITNEADYLLFESPDEDIKIQFEDCYNYSIRSLIKYLNSCQSIIKFININNKTIAIKSSKMITLKEGTHRAKLITGLYNTKEFTCNANEEIIVPDLPILDFANKLYLVSLQGIPMNSSIDDKEYTPSVIANIDTMIIDGEVLMMNYDMTKPIKIKTNTDSLKYLEMRLVDFMFKPIILKSPLFITLKIKPAKKADVYDILSK